ncbi:hypothetical protein [Sphingomonas phyllosphaerae]|uniref:hypothetical protein n=1 Tax=Sphingomonas phyllosphaerae TaxID=257003 RepID=UPI002FFC12C7
MFCQVGYFGPPEGLKNVTIDGRPSGRSAAFALISIGNAIRQPVSHLIGTLSARMGKTPIPLTDMFDRQSVALDARKYLIDRIGRLRCRGRPSCTQG